MATGPTVEELHEELARVCGGLNQLHARLVAVVAQALADESWAGAGIRSPEHWLSLRAGLSPVRARQVVALARRAVVLPTVMGAFAAGRLSVDQVVVVARHTPARVEASVAELARDASVPQLTRALSRYAFDEAEEARSHDTGNDDTGNDDTGNDGVGGDGAGNHDGVGGDGVGDSSGTGQDRLVLPPLRVPVTIEERAAEPATLSMGFDRGRFHLHYSAPADVGALVEAAVAEARDHLFAQGQPGVSFADGLGEVAHRSVGAVRSIRRRDAFRVYVHLDTEGGWLTGKPRLPRHIMAKLTRDGVLQPVWHTGGVPVNVGRSQRIVPDRTRTLVADRDRGCRFVACPATAHLEVHHLHHWQDGGETNLQDLLSLCPHHHDRHHAGDFTISGDPNAPDGLVFTTARGVLIRPGPTFTPPTKPITPLPLRRAQRTAPAEQMAHLRHPTRTGLHLIGPRSVGG